jgi:hypothetical protein
VNELGAMSAGTVLSLHRKLAEPEVFRVGTQNLFNASPARNGSQRAAHLISKITPANEKAYE